MSGVLHGVIASLKAAAAAVTDAFFEYVTLLLNTTSTNGAQNNTFLDSSTNNFTVTRNGETTQGSFNPYMPSGYWSGFFDGTDDYLTPTSTAIADFGTSDFTVECWVNLSSLGVTRCVMDSRSAAVDNQMLFQIETDNKAKFGAVVSGSVVYFVASTSTVVAGAWAHIAITRQGTTMRMFFNGALEDTQTNNTNFTQGTNRPVIGATGFTLGQNDFAGYISNLRIVKGTAVYTAAFTPPTTPLTAITNTSLLCLQDNRFKDNSTNNFTITRNGDTRISKFSPLSLTTAYDATTYGGSGYFDGGGDFLALPNNAAFTVGTGEVTIEAWIYCTSLTQPYQGIVSGRVETPSNYPGLGLVIDNSKLQFTIMNLADALTDPDNVPTNQWVHVVGVRNSSNNTALFVNGVRKVYSASNTANGTGADMVVGRYYTGTNNYYFSGYIASVRIVKGTAVYDPTQTTLTVPTAPLTAITNTQLLLNFTNAGIYDASTINDGQTVGNAQVSTTQAKFGTTSMYFDGTGDWLTMPGRSELAFGTGDFTVEFWMYVAANGPRILYDSRPASTSGAYPTIYINSSNKLIYIANSADRITGTTTISLNQWYHVALARSGTSTKLFLDGVQEGSTYTDSTNYLNGTNRPIVGANGNNTSFDNYNGYIDELRITNGYARYTGNFTPPTAAFPTL